MPLKSETLAPVMALFLSLFCTGFATHYENQFKANPDTKAKTISDHIAEDTSRLTPEGSREIVLSVTDLEAWTDFYTETLGWETRSTGPAPQIQLNAWNLPQTASASFALVANPGSKTGFVRLMDFDGVNQVRVRDHSQAWETGGTYNMNIRVPDISKLEPKFTQAGRQALSAPVNFTFGPFDVWEWLPRHKDGIRIALAQRVSPPLEGWPNLVTSYRAFNSTQIVKDMDRAVAFYPGILGLKTNLEHQGASDEPKDHVLGLSHQAMTTVIRDVRILSPSGENNGSIKLLEFQNYTGRDFSELTVPPNLGDLMLRYPVSNIDRLVAHLTGTGLSLEYPQLETILGSIWPCKNNGRKSA